jgi:glycosyltransferase involved in cell wall biosynthesis
LAELRVLRPERNGGHGRALRFGYRHVSNDYVFQTDSDRQHLPAEFFSLWDARADYDFVFGVRTHRADGSIRLFITKTMRIMNWLVWQVWIRDANCPFKLMKTGPLNKTLAMIPEESFIPMVMVSILSRKLGFKVREVEVTHMPRKGGTQSLKGLAKWLRVGATCAYQLFRLRLSWVGGHHGPDTRPNSN